MRTKRVCEKSPSIDPPINVKINTNFHLGKSNPKILATSVISQEVPKVHPRGEKSPNLVTLGSISRTFFSTENWVSAENSVEFFMEN
jgi:hypothetical protein